ncbi:MAG: hypothetical protein COB15_11435 [Flavobacteriales bacterium]|nr:MAG: hypothetical protein COB15_11435 [Flavobacteriales bacterium]
MSITSIRVTQITKKRLEKYKKKSGTHENILISFLDYFEHSGVKPSDLNMNPISIVKDSVERVVRILKNIENKKINSLMINQEFIIKKLVEKNTKKEDISSDDNITKEEAVIIHDNITNLESELKSAHSQIKLLNGKLSEKLSDNNDSNSKQILEEIKTLLLELDTKKTASKLIKNDYNIEKNLFKRNLDSALNLINNAV